MDLEIVPLNSNHSVLPFECGEEVLDKYIKGDARKNIERCIATTFVAVDPAEPARVHGFYSLQASELNGPYKPAGLKDHKGHALPVILVNYFGVNSAVQRKGIGETMLFDLYRRVQMVSDHVGFYAVYLSALDERVIPFYMKYDMKPISHDPKKLWIPISTIRDMKLKLGS